MRILCMVPLLLVLLTCELEETKDEIAATEAKKVGIVMPNGDARWGDQDGPGLQELLNAAGVENVLYYGDGTVVTEAGHVQTVIVEGCDVLLITVVDMEDSSAAISAAKNADLMVVLYDRPLFGDTDADFYVSIDNEGIGRCQGQALVDEAAAIQDQPLYLYTGASGDYNSWYFLAGAWEVLQPKIADGTFSVINSPKAVEYKEKLVLTHDELGEIINETSTEWSGTTTTTLVDSTIGGSSFDPAEPVYILGPNDYTARIIGDAFRTAGASVIITGQDGEIDSLQYIIDGKQTMSVIKRLSSLISTAATLTIAVAGSEDPDPSGLFNNGVVDIPYRTAPLYPVYTEEDIRDAVEQGWYEESDFDWTD